MTWHQLEIRLKPRPRGIHLVTHDVVAALPQLGSLRVGMLNLFIQHADGICVFTSKSAGILKTSSKRARLAC